jgi:phosphate-selective porin OprO and OprP
VGVNWYLNRDVKLMLDYDQTRFHDGAPGGDRPTEHAIMTRVQLVF